MQTLRLLLVFLCCLAVVPVACAANMRTNNTYRALLTDQEKMEKRLARKEKRQKRKQERLARRNERRKKKAERIAARMERIKDKPRNICPITKPMEGSSCQRHWRLPLCEYEFINAPVVLDDGSCSESIGCVPYSSCSCSRQRKAPDGKKIGKVWECADSTFATCQGVEAFDSSNSCNPETQASPTMSPTLAPAQNIFQRDDGTCPLQMPQTGAACQRSPDLLPCGYEFYNSPTFENDGSCVLPFQCLPQAGCSCFDGEWDCYTETQRRCNGPPPPGYLTSCTP